MSIDININSTDRMKMQNTQLKFTARKERRNFAFVHHCIFKKNRGCKIRKHLKTVFIIMFQNLKES